MKTWNKTISLLRNDEQKVVANGYPDLRVHRVLGSSIKGLDVQMLLDPFEEEFNLPALAIQFCNGQWVFNREVVGQEAIDFSALKVLIHNKSQRVRVLPSRVIAGESDSLVRKNARTDVDRSGLNHLIRHVVFSPSNKVGALLLEVLVKLLKSDIALVHQVECASFDRYLVHNPGIIDLAWSEQDKCGNRAAQIHQRMHLERALSMVELCPGTQLKTQFNGTAVKRIYHLFKTNPQLFILVKLRGFLHQGHRKVLIDTPILLLVGLRKRGSRHHLKPGTIEVSAEVKCSLNISQTSPVSELSKAHHHELVTAIELDGVPVTFVAVDTLLELVFVEERHDLSEDCFSFVHGLRMAS